MQRLQPPAQSIKTSAAPLSLPCPACLLFSIISMFSLTQTVKLIVPPSSISLPPLAPDHLPSADKPLDHQNQRLEQDTHKCSRLRNRSSKPLQSIGNQPLRPSSVPSEKYVTEKRSPRGALSQSNRTKRRRHAMNLHQH